MSNLNLEAIKARVEIVQMLPPAPGDNPTPMDMLARDASALIAEVERLQELASRLTLDNQEIQGANNLLNATVQERDKRIAALEQTLTLLRAADKMVVEEAQEYEQQGECPRCHQAITPLAPAPEAGPDDVLVGHGAECVCDTCTAYYAMKEEL